jgi:hypothetical protein
MITRRKDARKRRKTSNARSNKNNRYAADDRAAECGQQEEIDEGLAIVEKQLKSRTVKAGEEELFKARAKEDGVVWIAKDFTDEHRKTLDWLNDHTDENLELFGVRIEVWKVGDSLPAPRLNVVSRPASVVKQARGGTSNEDLTDTRKMQLAFWTAVRDSLKATGKIPSLHSPRPQYWFDVALGRTGIHLSAIANTFENRIGVRVYLSHKVAEVALEQLESEKAAIHEEIGCELTWNPTPEKRDKIILVDRAADLACRDKWGEYVEWITETIVAMRTAFHPRVKRLDLSAQGPANDDE